MNENPAGFFGTLSTWIQALGQFLYDNIGLSLLLLWCFTLFAMTEFAKPFLRRIMGSKEDAELTVKAFPQVMGAITGYWFFPAIVGTTHWGGAQTVSGPIGIGAGFVFGLVTIGIYELSRNGKVIRFTQLMVKRLAKKVPFLQLTDADLEYIAITKAGVPSEGVTNLQDAINSLKQFGDLQISATDDTIVITLKPAADAPSNDVPLGS